MRIGKETLIHLPQINIYHRHPAETGIGNRRFSHGDGKKGNRILIGMPALYIPYTGIILSVNLYHFIYQYMIKISGMDTLDPIFRAISF